MRTRSILEGLLILGSVILAYSIFFYIFFHGIDVSNLLEPKYRLSLILFSISAAMIFVAFTLLILREEPPQKPSVDVKLKDPRDLTGLLTENSNEDVHKEL